MAELEPGATFHTTRTLTLEWIRAYAEVSQDFNPLHLAPDFARQAGFRNVMAHGMLTLAMVDDLLADTFGAAWVKTGRLRVQFKAPAYAADDLVISCIIRSGTTFHRGRLITCHVGIKNQREEEIINGVAAVTIPPEVGDGT